MPLGKFQGAFFFCIYIFVNSDEAEKRTADIISVEFPTLSVYFRVVCST